MQLKGNVLIIGDSFCMNPEAWPDYLLKKIKCNKFKVHGEPGAAWWPIRERFLNYAADKEFFDNLDLLIFIHTQKDRIPTRDNRVFAIRPLKISKNNFVSNIDERVMAVSLYYKYLHDNIFLIWAQDQWFKEYSEICKNIPCVVNLFYDPPLSKIDVPGIKIGTGLHDLAMSQYDLEDPNVHELIGNDGLRGFRNHFTLENNQIFADQLYDIIVGNKKDFDKTKFKK